MWPYLLGAAAAGLAIGRQSYLKFKEEEQLIKEQEQEIAIRMTSARNIINLISHDCWQKSIKEGLIPDYDSQFAWMLFKYEYIPKDSNQGLNKKHIREAIIKELCAAIKEKDSKYDADSRIPIVAAFRASFRQEFEDHPTIIAGLFENICDTLKVNYNKSNAELICQQLLEIPDKGIGCVHIVIEGDTILKLRIAKAIAEEMNLNARKLIGELEQFLLKSYHQNSGVYESIIIDKLRKSDQISGIDQCEAIQTLIDSEELWDDLLEYCPYWSKNTKEGMLSRMSWDDLLDSQVYLEISKALDAESHLVLKAATQAFLEQYLLRLSKVYAWNLHNGNSNYQEILLTQIRDLLARPEFTESLSDGHSIRLAWDESLQTKLSYQIRDRVMESYSIAYAEEEELSHTLSGFEYEKLCGKILCEFGWSVEYTKGSNDQGVDLLATRDSIILCIQCKRHKSAVGNDAVQAIFAGKTFYSATHACVVTTSDYTKSAKELAASVDVALLKTKDLYSIHKKFSAHTSATS